jgi:hypothetical protein
MVAFLIVSSEGGKMRLSWSVDSIEDICISPLLRSRKNSGKAGIVSASIAIKRGRCKIALTFIFD